MINNKINFGFSCNILIEYNTNYIYHSNYCINCLKFRLNDFNIYKFPYPDRKNEYKIMGYPRTMDGKQ